MGAEGENHALSWSFFTITQSKQLLHGWQLLFFLFLWVKLFIDVFLLINKGFLELEYDYFAIFN